MRVCVYQRRENGPPPDLYQNMAVASTCSCPFCMETPCAPKLPLPLRMETPDGTAAHWAWLTELDDKTMKLEVMKSVGNLQSFTCICVATRTVCPGYDMNRATRPELKKRWHAMLKGVGKVSLSELGKHGVSGRVKRLPAAWTGTSVCHAPRSPAGATGAAKESAPPRAPHPPAAAGAAKESAPPRVRPKQKKPMQSEGGQKPIKKGKDSHTGDTSVPLGGDADEVARILEARPQWDQETVEELIRWGATPRLHKVAQIVQKPTHRMARCTFVQPDGRHVPDIWIPYGDLRVDYPWQVARFEDEEEK